MNQNEKDNPVKKNRTTLSADKNRIENLMYDILIIVGNKIEGIKSLAEKATTQKLTEHEFLNLKNQVDLCKPLIMERFLKDLAESPKTKTVRIKAQQEPVGTVSDQKKSQHSLISRL